MAVGRPLLLLHSAYGLRPAILEAQARFEAAGFVVETPDLYDAVAPAANVTEDRESGRATITFDRSIRGSSPQKDPSSRHANERLTLCDTSHVST